MKPAQQWSDEQLATAILDLRYVLEGLDRWKPRMSALEQPRVSAARKALAARMHILQSEQTQRSQS